MILGEHAVGRVRRIGIVEDLGLVIVGFNDFFASLSNNSGDLFQNRLESEDSVTISTPKWNLLTVT